MRKYRSGSSGILDAGTVVQILVFLLGLWGVLTIASSQSASPTALLIGKQLGALVGGMAVMLAAARIPFDFYRRQIWVLALLFFLPLLILPLAGVRVNGMCGWFRIGSFSLQPTEPAKGIFLLTLVVTMTSLRSENLRFWGALAVAGIWLVPIFLQPDFGTSAIYLAGFAAVYFLAGGRVRNLLIFCTGAAAAAALFVWSHPYAWRRITGLFQPELDPLGSGWHVRQFGLAIARGQFFGEKLGHAVWSNAYLPLSYNDSAFATMAETLGFFGTLPVYLGFALLIASLVVLANRFDLEFDARLYILSAAALIGIQSLVHISVNLCLLPPTGLTLPLISYGGSSLIGCCLMLGIALSAARCHRSY